MEDAIKGAELIGGDTFLRSDCSSRAVEIF